MNYLIRVKANHDCWIADVIGDPGRTTIRENARVYSSKYLANNQKEHWERNYPNRSFSIEKAITNK
ncbi:unnamed protein product [marine sediment metagenome]|uniref:Uncharacterized protein n=1 Tax=marine sediment metagenome TaxID=412755 RepID=X0Z2G3_9ZZZZ